MEVEKTEATVENKEVETSAMKSDLKGGSCAKTGVRRSERVNKKPEWLREDYVPK